MFWLSCSPNAPQRKQRNWIAVGAGWRCTRCDQRQAGQVAIRVGPQNVGLIEGPVTRATHWCSGFHHKKRPVTKLAIDHRQPTNKTLAMTKWRSEGPTRATSIEGN